MPVSYLGKRQQHVSAQTMGCKHSRASHHRETSIASPLRADIAEEDAEGDDTVLGELPLEVLQHMFSLLDPVTLGAASCVCTTWYALSQDDSLWQRCLAQVAVASSSSHNRSATRRQQFNAVVASKAVMLCKHTLCSNFAIVSYNMW